MELPQFQHRRSAPPFAFRLLEAVLFGAIENATIGIDRSVEENAGKLTRTCGSRQGTLIRAL
ncbi:hypothetical protein V5F53_10935 [Xanthobacter sp. V4C-4]|uniref:hypothetical protein n=1 Tax=Xanthobacter cornucopiae TaxID=3119924 RepID=UPI0037286FD9